MKQLSLLVLAGLTTGCFAQEAPKASCWEFVKMMHDPNQADRTALKTVIGMAGFIDCTQRLAQIKRMLNDEQLNQTDRTALKAVKRAVIAYSNTPEESSLEAAIARDEAMVQEFLARTQYVETDEAAEHNEELKAGLAKARSHLNLIEEAKEVDARPKAIITDTSFLAESKEIIENKTRELKARKPIIS